MGLLVVSRYRDEIVKIGHAIDVIVVDIRGDKVRLGIKAPRELQVHRKEVYDAIQRANHAAPGPNPIDRICADTEAAIVKLYDAMAGVWAAMPEASQDAINSLVNFCHSEPLTGEAGARALVVALKIARRSLSRPRMPAITQHVCTLMEMIPVLEAALVSPELSLSLATHS